MTRPSPLECANDPRPLEVEWYRKHGRYPERIARSRACYIVRRVPANYARYKTVREPSEPYVIGDFSWNRAHPDKNETIERRMRYEGIYS